MYALVRMGSPDRTAAVTPLVPTFWRVEGNKRPFSLVRDTEAMLHIK